MALYGLYSTILWGIVMKKVIRWTIEKNPTGVAAVLASWVVEVVFIVIMYLGLVERVDLFLFGKFCLAITLFLFLVFPVWNWLFGSKY